MGDYTVIWDVEDETFGGTYSLKQDCSSYEEAQKFARDIQSDALVSNVEIYGDDYD